VVAKVREGGDWAFAQGGEDSQGTGCGATDRSGAAYVFLEKIGEPAGGFDCPMGCCFHAFQKEIHPGFPVAGGADAVEQVVIHRAVRFQVEGKIEQRLCKQATVVQEQGDEEAAEAAIAIKKRVNGLELHMGQRGFDQHGQADGFFVEEGFQRGHAGLDLWRRGRNEAGVAWTGASDPILATAKLSRLFVAASAFGHEDGVHFTKQAVGEREAFAQAGHAVIQSRDVVGHLDDIIHRTAGHFFQLEKQKVGERGLCAFDLRRKNGFAPDIGVEEKVGIRKERADTVQPPQSQGSPLQQ
jgi:hypothetical protein